MVAKSLFPLLRRSLVSLGFIFTCQGLVYCHIGQPGPSGLTAFCNMAHLLTFMADGCFIRCKRGPTHRINRKRTSLSDRQQCLRVKDEGRSHPRVSPADCVAGLGSAAYNVFAFNFANSLCSPSMECCMARRAGSEVGLALGTVPTPPTSIGSGPCGSCSLSNTRFMQSS